MAGERRLLIVHAEAVAAEALVHQLALTQDLRAEAVRTVAAARAAAAAAAPDIVLAGTTFADGDAAELVAALRAADMVEPVLVLGEADDPSVAAAMDAGADDAVPAPIRLVALLGRIRSRLSRHEVGHDAVVSLGPHSFRPGMKQIDVEGRVVRLTEKETAILRYLMRAGGPVARDELLSQVWGYNSGVTTHTLETHVYRLRQKIEPDPAAASILVTDPAGYRLLS
jgi:DNA-binding response OmpR family regulator